MFLNLENAFSLGDDIVIVQLTGDNEYLVMSIMTEKYFIAHPYFNLRLKKLRNGCGRVSYPGFLDGKELWFVQDLHLLSKEELG